MAYTVSDEELERRRRLAEELAQRQQNYGTYRESDYVKGLRDKATSLGEQLDNYSPFSFTRQADYDKAYGDYMNRKKFTWDADSDALYNLYKDKYMRGGQMAMQDAMGQAAALSGGYGNSYAATVGNQAYQNYLTGLNDVVPQLYQLALDRYNAEGNDLKAKIGLLQGERDTEYGQYNDAYNRLANSYSRNYGLYGDERGREQSDFDTAYARLVDSYNIANTDFRNAVADQQAAAQLAASRRSSGGSVKKDLSSLVKSINAAAEKGNPYLYDYLTNNDFYGWDAEDVLAAMSMANIHSGSGFIDWYEAAQKRKPSSQSSSTKKMTK